MTADFGVLEETLALLVGDALDQGQDRPPTVTVTCAARDGLAGPGVLAEVRIDGRKPTQEERGRILAAMGQLARRVVPVGPAGDG